MSTVPAPPGFNPCAPPVWQVGHTPTDREERRFQVAKDAVMRLMDIYATDAEAHLAKRAVCIADALLAELERTKK